RKGVDRLVGVLGQILRMVEGGHYVNPRIRSGKFRKGFQKLLVFIDAHRVEGRQLGTEPDDLHMGDFPEPLQNGADLLGAQNQRIAAGERSEEHTSELQSRENLVCRLLLEKKK